MKLSDEQVKTLYMTVDSEVRCLVNEWDPSTNRMPSETRMKEKATLLAVREKILSHSKERDAGLKLVNIDALQGGELALTTSETKSLRKLLVREKKGLEREAAKGPTTYKPAPGSYYDLIARSLAELTSVLTLLPK